MFAVCFITLCLMSLSHQAPLACEDLVRPLDRLDHSHMGGTMALVAASLAEPVDLENFKRRDSASVTFSNASEPTEMSFIGKFRFGDDCRYLSSIINLEGASFYLKHNNLTVTALQTSCPDCAAMRFDSQSKELKRLYLFSRRREVEQKEMEEFKAQVECLNLPPVVLMDPTKDLCPEPIPTDPAA